LQKTEFVPRGLHACARCTTRNAPGEGALAWPIVLPAKQAQRRLNRGRLLRHWARAPAAEAVTGGPMIEIPRKSAPPPVGTLPAMKQTGW